MDSARVARHIADWLGEYLKGSGARGFVVGVSGGVDSAVVAALAAMTGAPTLCVALPIHQDAGQVSRGTDLIASLAGRHANVRAAEADLTAAYDTFEAAFPVGERSDAAPGVVAMAGANARSRLRMTALYYFAGLHNMLVAGTGNKIEDFGIGFFTKYGDGGVDLSPIGDLTKSEVYELAAYLGVPESILRAAPTDGLFGDERTDEQQIGATYPELERAMALAEQGVDPASLSGREREVYDIYVRRNRANRHKMVPVPVCEVPQSLK